MKNQLFSIFTFGLLVLLFSCKKDVFISENTLYVEGYVLHPNGEPAKDAWVTISGDGKAEIVYCEANGHYEKKLKVEGENFVLKANGPENLYTAFTATERVKAGKYTKMNLILKPNCWIRIHVKNTSPVDDYDHIIINGECFHTGNTPEQYGRYIDTYLTDYRGEYFNVIADNYIGINWDVTKGGVLSKFEDSIFVSAFDTVEFRIEY